MGSQTMRNEDTIPLIKSITESIIVNKNKNPEIPVYPFIAAIKNLETEEYIYQNFSSDSISEEIQKINYLAKNNSLPAPIVIYGAEMWYSNIWDGLLGIINPSQDPDRKEMILVQAYSRLGTTIAYTFFKKTNKGLSFESIKTQTIATIIPLCAGVKNRTAKG